mgnify:CR=1 FL=1
MDGINGENKTKNIIIFSIISVFVIGILVGILVVVNKSNSEKARKEKEEKVANLKADTFLNKISKEEWTKVFEKGCKQKNEGLRKERFSWIDKEGNPQLMDGYFLEMSFKKKKNSKCCGSVSKFGEKITTYFKSQDFVENLTNTNSDSNVYAFENLDFKCVYGYGEVENKETFCNFSIVCGRLNTSLTNSDFSKIYTMYNPDKKSDRMVIIDKLIDIPEGNFAKGRIVIGFYFSLPKEFIAMKNIKGEWISFGDPFGVNRIDSCWDLLNNNCPPVVVNNKCYDKEKGGFIRYDVFYKEKNK